MASIRIGGLATGMDTDALVQQLMQAKRIPIDKMFQQKTLLEWKRDDYREMNTLMSSFRTELDKLRFDSTLMKKTASTSNEMYVSATPNSSTVNGNYTMQVKQVAKAATIVSGTLGISGSHTTTSLTATDVTLAIEGELNSGSPTNITITAGSKITDVVQKINNQSATTGVKATYDQLTDRLTFTSTKTGAAAKINISEAGTDHFLSNVLKMPVTNDPTGDPTTPDTTGTYIGQDAIVNLNGTGDTNVRSNSFTMNNISFTIRQDPDMLGMPDYTVSVSVSNDVDSMVDIFKSFVDKYNEVISTIYDKTHEKRSRNYLPLTQEQKDAMKENEIELWEEKAKAGLLRGDTSLSMAMDKLRLQTINRVDSIGTAQYDYLDEIGISVAKATGTNQLQYSEHGKLHLDEEKLRRALTDNPEQVMALLTKDGARDAQGRLTNPMEAGIATRLYDSASDLIAELTKKTSIDAGKSVLTRQINDYSRRIDDANSRLAQYEQRYYSQFAVLEKSIAKMNSQGSWLQSMLGGGGM